MLFLDNLVSTNSYYVYGCLVAGAALVWLIGPGEAQQPSELKQVDVLIADWDRGAELIVAVHPAL